MSQMSEHDHDEDGQMRVSEVYATTEDFIEALKSGRDEFKGSMPCPFCVPQEIDDADSSE